MTLDLYVDIRSQTLIQSHRNGGKFVVPRQYREQQIPLRVFYVSPNATGGAANPFTIEDSSGYTSVRVAIGGFANPLAVCSGLSYNVVDDCWEDAELNLNTVELLAAVDAASGGELSSIFETEAFHASSLIKTQDPVVVRRSVLTSSSGMPTPVTETLFCDLLELCLGNSDTLTWRRVADDMLGDVPIFGAPGVLGPLSITYALVGAGPACTPTSDTDAATVGGLAGERYLIRARFTGSVEIKSYTAGTQKPGDDARIYRGGNNAGEASTDEWYLDISSPAQRIWLNFGTPAVVTAVDHFVRFVADAGATVTLGFDSKNGGSSASGSGSLAFVSASEVLTNDKPSSYESIAFSSAGNTDVTPPLDSATHGVIATVTAGAGAFTRTVSLLTANSTAGDRCVISFIMPASANPTIQVRNATSGGTLLHTLNGSASGNDAYAEFLFDGTAWNLVSSGLAGSALNNWTESGGTYSSKDFVKWAPASGGNTTAVIAPAGNGSFQLNQSDGGSTNGNNRGIQAVDLSMARLNASEVASGDYSFATGFAATASGTYSQAQGRSCVAEGEASRASGKSAKADKLGQHAHSSGGFSVSGDSQASSLTLRNITTDATPTELYLDGDSETTRCTVPADTLWRFSIQVVARRASGASHASWKIEGTIYRNSTAGSTAILGDVEVSPNSANEAGWDFAVSADTTNGALKMLATGGAYNVRWTAAVQLSEITYA